jgi:ATP-dependent protease ClpP protease subunit
LKKGILYASDDDESEDLDVSADMLFMTNNHIHFYQDISVQTAAIFNKTIYEAYCNILHTMIGSGLSDPTIEIHINSPGGQLFGAFAMAHQIETLQKGIPPLNVPIKINTHVEGESSSASTLISVLGNYRTIGKHSCILIHECYGTVTGNQQDFKKFERNVKTQSNEMKRIYEQYTKLRGKELEDILEQDRYLSAEECLAFGFVDSII